MDLHVYYPLVQLFSVIPRGVPLPHSNILQYYVKRVKCKLNDVIFPSGCEARAINLGNKNVKIGIFTGGTSVRSKNIFTDVFRYPTGKHEIISVITDDIYLKLGVCSLPKEQSVLSRETIQNAFIFRNMALFSTLTFCPVSSTPQPSVGTRMRYSCYGLSV